ncbi:cupin domain-containing protein [Massilia sp. S19_KUP03_FR1]|uniref:cupin domain-containing protein n=1 Tax=Massilia sp. S19_KUP03_FR1 TaxID=3025503 RepID=UPI002FCDC10C
MSLNPQETYVLLGADGVATPLPGGDQFWQLPEVDLAHCGDGWLVSEYLFEANWHSWEMHPYADEFVYLLSGTATLHLEQADGVHIIVLGGSGAVIVPRGIWHTAKVTSPCRMLHITRGAGTQTRPA